MVKYFVWNFKRCEVDEVYSVKSIYSSYDMILLKVEKSRIPQNKLQFVLYNNVFLRNNKEQELDYWNQHQFGENVANSMT